MDAVRPLPRNSASIMLSQNIGNVNRFLHIFLAIFKAMVQLIGSLALSFESNRTAFHILLL